ncbi:diacylglycerol O-acyltransferase 1 [Exophiala xenobiotica]|nr:diacylglycerol O-acyltransferase 1 [Exophiala xenobiotica]KAK5401152.1 diacylglycerol O-acyltransferase 1 [Exophiala xenobiotica]KAK5409079.1 diacylglycerol O-acyltransferase 1 [Exophiala xenobiotica]KAK5459983.1 diacylglycerol O-acyltransferase 1 [Exophiala xenobiotica]KAK5488921.1 diacylglycerol O-acyltransferase 1 [Exophiala xenobiotica]
MASTTSPDGLTSEPADPQDRAAHSLPPKSYAQAVNKEEAAPMDQQEQEQRVNGSATNGERSNGTETVDGSTNGERSNGNGMVNGHKEKVDDAKVLYKEPTSQNGQIPLTSIKPSEEYEEGLRHNAEAAPHKDVGPGVEKGMKKRQDVPIAQQAAPHLASGRQAGAGWQNSAIRWAPLNVPLQRRLQTLAVLWHTTTIPIFLSLFFLLCAIPLTWPLLIPYLLYILLISEDSTNGTLSRRSNWLRRSKFWSAFASYFPARLHRTVQLEPTRKYILGYHPHGIISHGAFAAFGTEALGFADLFPGITNTLLTLDTNFRVPLYRDYALAMGLASVSRESIENLLSRGGHNGEGMGRAVTIVIGGARESLDAQPHSLRLVLKSRKGFVKLAIRTGADLVPVLAFGENELYEQVDSEEHPWIHNLQMVVKKGLGFTVPLFHARGIFNYDVGLLPYRRAVNVVVGRPIKVVQQGGRDGKVDEKYLDEVHQRYVDELLWLWNEYKDTFATDRTGELEIVE